MDPMAQQIALEQMKKMSPEQMQQMYSQASRMMAQNPNLMQEAAQRMAQMNSTDWEAVQSQLKGMSADDMSRMASAADQHGRSQREYQLKASAMLKEEGNKLLKQGDLRKALEKYSLAKSNAQRHSVTQAVDLGRSCALNMALCYLNLGEYSSCISECDDVLKLDKGNVKALYRRGQALAKTARLQESQRDLQHALELLQPGDTQRQLIQSKMDEVVAELAKHPPPASGGAGGAGSSEEEGMGRREGGAAGQLGGAEDVDPGRLREMASALRSDPGMKQSMADALSRVSDEELKQLGLDRSQMAQATEAFGQMTPEDMDRWAQMMSEMSPEALASLRAQAAAAGPGSLNAGAGGGITSEQVRMAQEMVEKNPELLSSAMKMMTGAASDSGQSTVGDGGGEGGGWAGPASAPEGRSWMPSVPAKSELPADGGLAVGEGQPGGRGAGAVPDRETLQSMSRMMRSMPPEAMQKMMEAAAGSGAVGRAGGDVPQLTPDMMKMAADMMEKMTPEDFQRLQQLSGGVARSSAGPPGPADMGRLMKDADAMDSALKMMQGMGEENLARIMSQAMPAMPEEQARVAAKHLSTMSDGQRKMMARTAQAVGVAGEVAQSAKQLLLSRAAFVAAAIVLVIGLLLRWLNLM